MARVRTISLSASGSSERTSLDGQLDAELVSDPGAGRSAARNRGRGTGPRRKVGLPDDRAGLVDEELGHAVAADLLQIAIAKAQTPAGVGQLGQRFPVPFRLRRRRRAGSPRWRRAAGPPAAARPRPRTVSRPSAKSRPRNSRASSSIDSSLPAHFGKRLGAVVPGQKLIEVMVDLLVDHLEDAAACSSPPSRMFWR